MNKFKTWEEVRDSLNITPEQEAEIQLESELIQATIKARKENKITQEELSQKTGLTQSVIARVESGRHSTNTSTLIKMLLPMGYTLGVVPCKNHKVVSGASGHKVNNKTNNA